MEGKMEGFQHQQGCHQQQYQQNQHKHQKRPQPQSSELNDVVEKIILNVESRQNNLGVGKLSISELEQLSLLASNSRTTTTTTTTTNISNEAKISKFDANGSKIITHHEDVVTKSG